MSHDLIEPGALRGQQERQNAHAFPGLLDLLVVLAYPGTNGLTLVPGGVIPDQEPVVLATLEQTLTAPLQELRRDCAPRGCGHEEQPGLRTIGLIGSPLLQEQTVARQHLGIRVVLSPELLHQPYGLVKALPGVNLGRRKAAPPDFIAKANCPAWLLAGPGNQATPFVFFAGTTDQGW